MSKHTPGPWTIEDDASECVVSRDPEANEFYIVARTHGPDDEANARLISAAPDLLAVCKRCAAVFGPLHLGEPLTQAQALQLVTIYTEIRAAIAKAEGEGVS